MKCPRRMEAPDPSIHSVREDDTGEDGVCSYCGSLLSEVFMERLEKGDVRLDPTDKNYKVYVNNQDGAKFKRMHRSCTTKCNFDTCTHWVVDETDHSKFYFQHLSDPQKERFIELYNQGKLSLGEPGYFYRLPFFCKPAPLLGSN